MNELRDAFLKIPITPTFHHLNPLAGKHEKLQRKDIKLLSYNIFLRPPPVKNNESDHKNDRLKEFAKVLKDYDVICLQEMFGFLNKRKHKLINCANKSGFGYYAESPSPSFFSTYVADGGLLVLSRFPIVTSEFHTHPYGILSDSLAQKGWLYSKIQIRDTALHLFSTHTQASYFGSDQIASVITRGDQFLEGQKFIDQCLRKHNHKDKDIVLIVGDFNVDARKPYYPKKEVTKYPAFKRYPDLNKGDQLNEYEAMVHILSDGKRDTIVDILHEQFGEHPVTYGASEMDTSLNAPVPEETILTHKDDWCSNQSLDYLFQLIPNRIKHLEKSKSMVEKGVNTGGSLEIVEKSASVDKLYCDGQTFKQLSDHYGVSCHIRYNTESETAKIDLATNLFKAHSLELQGTTLTTMNTMTSMINLESRQ
jgi:endonuclease/exonuclease/phosphatase family metal-dependent hydrolase